MELPQTLKNDIENRLRDVGVKDVLALGESISKTYRENASSGKRLVTANLQALAYAASRMPATFGAVSTVLSELRRRTNLRIDTVTDVGAGTGTAAWAAAEIFNPETIVCLERESVMRDLGKSLAESAENAAVKNARWLPFDLTRDDIDPAADLIGACYVLNELNAADREKAVLKLWNATRKALVIVEPGTPAVFSILREIATVLRNAGAFLIAPCPVGTTVCPLDEDDWCHGVCRVARSRLHKMMKGGAAPFEDEKFSYLIFTRRPFDAAKNRVLRHPKIASGRVSCVLCAGGRCIEKTFFKKDGDACKQAKKACCGDEIESFSL